MNVNIDIDKMVAIQGDRFAAIEAEEPINEEYDDTCYHNVEKVVSFTRMTSHEGSVLLFRCISNKVVKVLFAEDVKVVDILPYFDLNDDKFILCSRVHKFE